MPELRKFFDTFATALTAGDGKAIATMWTVPALVISENGTRAVSTKDEVEQFFSGSKDQYAAMGVVETQPELGRVQWVGERIAIVDVRWPHLDSHGREQNAECSTYTLLRGHDGKLRIVSVVMHGVEKPIIAAQVYA